MRLDDPNINYIIISAYQSNEDTLTNRLENSKLEDTLIYKDFNVMEMSGKQPSFLAYKECDNNEIRYDAIELLDKFKQQYVIVKYLEESIAKKILHDGRESLLGIIEFSGDESHHNFFVEGNAFSFEPRKRFWVPSRSDQFKEGMIIEVKNNNGEWTKREVRDPEVEFERMYKLLIKYEKLRVEFNDDHLI